MIVLYKRGNPIKDISGKIIGYGTQAVFKPNNFFTYTGLSFDWKENTVSWRNDVYYMDKLSDQTAISQIPTTEEWLSSYGNWIETIYYSSNQKEGNPSGNVDNIYRLIYRNDINQPKYILEYEYDNRDNVVSMKSLPPDGATAISEANKYNLIIYNEHGETKEYSYSRNSNYELFEPDDVDGYRFLYYKDLDGKKYNTNESLKMTSNLELITVWQKTVKFVIKGISEEINQEFDINTQITIDAGIPQRDNYKFINYLDANGIAYMPGQKVILDTDLVLEAQWQSEIPEDNQEEV